MSDEATVEKRLAALEQMVADLQRQIAGSPNTKSWLEKVGRISDEEAFLQALEYGKFFRYSDKPRE